MEDMSDMFYVGSRQKWGIPV